MQFELVRVTDAPDTLAQLRAQRETNEEEEERRESAAAFNLGRQWAQMRATRREAQRVASIDTSLIDDWHPMSAYGWGLDLYLAIRRIHDMADADRADLECVVESLMGESCPDAEQVCAFIEGVQEAVDEQSAG